MRTKIAVGLGLVAVALVAQKAKVDFVKDIAPVLKGRCGQCHGADSSQGGLRLDTADGVKKGGASGPLFKAGDSKNSLLIRRLQGLDGKPPMPMGFTPLPENQIALVRDWIDQGAQFAANREKHWAYVPPRRPALPQDTEHPIDYFIRSRLHKEGLKLSPEATRETLIRRLSLDLTGLPPTIEEIDAYLNDRSSNAYEKVVDRLLASPHYGERMGRVWLDLARYADTNGYEKDLPRQMWLYRDWLIDAFNKNMPYDQFTIEQLAGDLLPNPTDSQLIASAFNRNSMLNDEGGIDPEEFRVVAVMDRVNTVATTWLGTTLACAQCHSHKYDPFPQRDYYRFYAFFNTSEDNGRDTAPILRAYKPEQKAEVAEIESSLKSLEASLPKTVDRAWFGRQLKAWQVVRPSSVSAGATTRILPDDSVLASGADTEADTYTIELQPKQAFVGLRLEALTDKSLPEGSSGRNFNGNFVIQQITVKAGDREVPIAEARTDFAQGGHSAKDLIKGDGLGWAIAGFEPANRVTHEVFLRLSEPVPPGETVTVTLLPSHRFAHHNIGRFRLSVTNDDEVATSTPPTAETTKLLASKKPTDKLLPYYLANALALREASAGAEGLRKRQDEITDMTPTVMVMREMERPRETHRLDRGDFRTPGEIVRPGVPASLGGYAPRENRLGLARWLVNPQNPLTARVEVNRLWEQFFGRGIVATMEDFGTQGERPTHPELLDWLATELVRLKWDVKALQKEIVMSATYRQTSRASKELLQKDPYNALYARGPRFRAESETVRDIALAASGRLTPTIGGPSVMPPQPMGIWENSFSFYDTTERWKDEMGPNRYRRGIYTYWRRTAPFPTALTFDTNSRDVCSAHRTRTNTPLQALNTLNDPLFVECAGSLGSRMMALGSHDLSAGLVAGFRLCTSRRPTERELRAISDLFLDRSKHYAGNLSDARRLLADAHEKADAVREAELAAYIVVANVLLNLDETVTKG